MRASLGAQPGQQLVGIVGRVDEGKGVEVLLEAMACDTGPVSDAHLAIVGDVGVMDDGFLDRVKRRAAELLETRVTFAGRRADVPAVMRCLDVLVNASDAEPFGRSVLEAQATGTAVIGTTAGGIPEFVANEMTGLLVPASSPEALRQLQRILGDDELRSRLADAGRTQAVSSFDVVTRYDAMAEVYRGLLLAVERHGERRRLRACPSQVMQSG